MQISYNYDNLPRDGLVFVEFSESETGQVIGSNRELGVIVSSRFTYVGWAEFNASKIMVEATLLVFGAGNPIPVGTTGINAFGDSQ